VGAGGSGCLRGGGFAVVVKSGGVGVGRRRAAAAGGKDQFGGLVLLALAEEHVAAGTVEEVGEDDGGGGGAVFAEDALVGDATSDLHAGLARDVAEDAVEAGVVGGDFDEAAAVDHLIPVGR
jgi:hypothetical protein